MNTINLNNTYMQDNMERTVTDNKQKVMFCILSSPGSTFNDTNELLYNMQRILMVKNRESDYMTYEKAFVFGDEYIYYIPFEKCSMQEIYHAESIEYPRQKDHLILVAEQYLQDCYEKAPDNDYTLILISSVEPGQFHMQNAYVKRLELCWKKRCPACRIMLFENRLSEDHEFERMIRHFGGEVYGFDEYNVVNDL